jgi:hypothetical protein
MELKEALQIFETLKATKHTQAFDWMVKSAVRYAGIRAEWYFAQAAEQNMMDDERTIAHDAFIHACDVLSLKMKENGESSAWRIAIGSDRKSIGDFACLVHAIIAIKAR